MKTICRAPIVVAMLLVGLSAAATPSKTAQPDPRWSEAGRRHILALTDQLEKRPLASDAKEITTELVQWWTDVPDVTINVCAGPFVDGKNEKTKPILVVQTMLGTGAFLLRSGDKRPSDTDATMAGVQSALETYKNAVKADPSYRDPLVDQLLSDPKRMKSYLDKKLAGCRKADSKAGK